MVGFEFRDGELPIDMSTHPRAYICDRFLDIVRIPMESVACPVHGQDAHAVIRVDVQKPLSDWTLSDQCCDVFREEIESAMPFPWTRTPHHLQP